MSDWSKGFFLGVLIVAVVALVVFLLRKLSGKSCGEFDERQVAARGKAFKAAYFTLMFYLCVDVCVAIGLEHQWGDMAAQMITGVLLSVLVFVTVALKNDAYFSMSENVGRLLVLFAALGVLNLVIGIRSVLAGECIMEGTLTFRSMNLMVGIMFIILFLELGIKKIVDSRKDGE